MGRVWSERVVDVKLFHYLDSTYQGSGRTHRYRTQALQLTRPSGAVYSTTGRLLLITETGMSGPGARRTARQHTLQPVAHEPDTGALTCEHCGHREPLDSGGYVRMRQHRCRN